MAQVFLDSYARWGKTLEKLIRTAHGSCKNIMHKAISMLFMPWYAVTLKKRVKNHPALLWKFVPKFKPWLLKLYPVRPLGPQYNVGVGFGSAPFGLLFNIINAKRCRRSKIQQVYGKRILDRVQTSPKTKWKNEALAQVLWDFWIWTRVQSESKRVQNSPKQSKTVHDLKNCSALKIFVEILIMSLARNFHNRVGRNSFSNVIIFGSS